MLQMNPNYSTAYKQIGPYVGKQVSEQLEKLELTIGDVANKLYKELDWSFKESTLAGYIGAMKYGYGYKFLPNDMRKGNDKQKLDRTSVILWYLGFQENQDVNRLLRNTYSDPAITTHANYVFPPNVPEGAKHLGLKDMDAIPKKKSTWLW